MKKLFAIACLICITKFNAQSGSEQNLKPSPKKDSSTVINHVENEKYIGISKRLLKKNGWIKNRNSDYNRGILGYIKGVYAGDKKIFILTEFQNKTNINYDVENISFISNPTKNGEKQIEAEEKIFVPIHQTESNVIEKKSSRKVVFVFEKFTISDNKNILLIMNEIEGERNISLEIKPKYISNAEFTN